MPRNPLPGISSHQLQAFETRFEALKGNRDRLDSTARREALMALEDDIFETHHEASAHYNRLVEIMDACEQLAMPD